MPPVCASWAPVVSPLCQPPFLQLSPTRNPSGRGAPTVGGTIVTCPGSAPEVGRVRLCLVVGSVRTTCWWQMAPPGSRSTRSGARSDERQCARFRPTGPQGCRAVARSVARSVDPASSSASRWVDCQGAGWFAEPGAPDLGMITWAALRLRYGDQASVTTYQELARLLNLGDLTVSAVEKRFRAALGPLLGSWIIREPAYDNLYSYRAVLPESAQADRYAILRRSDLALMAERGSSHLGQLGQTIWPTSAAGSSSVGVAVGPPTLSERSGSGGELATPPCGEAGIGSAALGLLEVVSRSGGRHSDLVWLKELYDPHWTVPSTTTLSTGGAPLSPDRPDLWNNGGGLSTASSAPVGVCGTSMGGGEGLADAHAADVEHFWGVLRNSGRGRCGSSPSGPIKELTGSLPDDLSDLGGASAPPLASVTREIAAAAPAAPRPTS